MKSSEFERSWRPNRSQQVNFWGTPENLWTKRSKWAMWKVGGLKIVTAASRRIILPGWNRNWWKSAFFYKTLRTRKFSRGKFFEGSTHGNLLHSRFRICVLKGSGTHFWPCYSCPKSGEGGKTRFASKNKEALKKITRLPENFSCKIQLLGSF